MTTVQRIFADDKLMGSGTYTDAMVVDLGNCYQVIFSGIAALDPSTGTMAGYESHNGTFMTDALERQVEDIFDRLLMLMASVSSRLDTEVTLEHLTRAMVFLREDYPLVFRRFNDAYISEFAKLGVGVYPTRTTVMKTTLPDPNALVEIQFEAVVAK